MCEDVKSKAKFLGLGIKQNQGFQKAKADDVKARIQN